MTSHPREIVMKTCEICKKPYYRSNRTKFCLDCSIERKREKQRMRNRTYKKSEELKKTYVTPTQEMELKRRGIYLVEGDHPRIRIEEELKV